MRHEGWRKGRKCREVPQPGSSIEHERRHAVAAESIPECSVTFAPVENVLRHTCAHGACTVIASIEYNLLSFGRYITQQTAGNGDRDSNCGSMESRRDVWDAP